MTHDQTMQAVGSIAKSYFCPFCLDRSVAAKSTIDPLALVRFNKCDAHRDLYQRKRCPCGKPWAHCLACKDDRADPRAGAAFCPACRLRYGGNAAASARFCACRRSPAAAQASPQPSSSDDDALASDSHLHNME